MSFSSETKTELCRSPVSRGCCVLAEAYGILLYCNTFTARELRIITGSDAFADRLPRLFRRAFGLSFDTRPPADARGKRSFLIADREKLRRIFNVYGFEAESALVHHINLGMLEEDCCRASFLRGAFLAGGGITDPDKRYHMEFVTSHHSVSRETYSIFLEMDFTPKDTVRSGGFVTYFKQSETIEDLLTTLGAPLAAMGVMQAKVEKDMRNAVNRRVNCDSANADKIVSAAQEQMEAIRRIEWKRG
jgi:DNA-binding protein WhiA